MLIKETMRVSFSLFKNEHAFLNSLNIFTVTLLGSFIGSHARLSDVELSIFWPINIILVALFYRCQYLNTFLYYGVAYSAMVIQDSVFHGWSLSAFTINTANIVFIVVLLKLLAWPAYQPQHDSDMTTAFRLFTASLIAALSCALIGAFAQQLAPLPPSSFAQNALTWFSEQFYTATLFLPLLLTLRSSFTFAFPTYSWRALAPLGFLLLSLFMGALIAPIAILAFPLPALTWCAIAYPLWAIRLIILCTGLLELFLTALHIQLNHMQQDTVFMYEITIARLCIAVIIFCPLLMAMNAKTIRQLNQRLMLQACQDFLTNLLSRYGFTEALKHFGHSPHYRHVPVNVMLIDIDHFKQINDNFGHDYGDVVLKQVATVIRQVIAEPGLVSRIGGEEFGVVCFGYSQESFYQLAETVRCQICDTPVVVNHHSVPVAASIGIACAPNAGNDLADTVHLLFTAADKNLYIAKRGGRNRSVQ